MQFSYISKERIEIYLQSLGFSLTEVSLRFDRKREFSEVWQAHVFTSNGDAILKIILYNTKDNPSLIVDYEEERAALQSFVQMDTSSPSTPVLVFSETTDEFAVLITTSVNEAATAKSFFEKRQKKEDSTTQSIELKFVSHAI